MPLTQSAAGTAFRLVFLCSVFFCLSQDAAAVVAGSAGNLYEPGVSSLPYPGNGRGLSLDGLDVGLCRLPLTPPSEALLSRLRGELGIDN